MAQTQAPPDPDRIGVQGPKPQPPRRQHHWTVPSPPARRRVITGAPPPSHRRDNSRRRQRSRSRRALEGPQAAVAPPPPSTPSAAPLGPAKSSAVSRRAFPHPTPTARKAARTPSPPTPAGFCLAALCCGGGGRDRRGRTRGGALGFPRGRSRERLGGWATY